VEWIGSLQMLIQWPPNTLHKQTAMTPFKVKQP